MATPLEAAIELSRVGLLCFPLSALNKKPLTEHGFEDATGNIANLTTLFSGKPDALIGVPTGSAPGFDIVDVDVQHGGLDWLAEVTSRLPITRTHRTRSGGLHIFLEHAPGMRNSESRIAPGVDVRGTGGYIVWWAAVGFEVTNGDALASWPAWLSEAAYPQPKPAPAPWRPSLALEGGGTTKSLAYANAALTSACRNVATAPQGSKPDETLFKEACGMARLIAIGSLTHAFVISELSRAAVLHGVLDDREINRAIERAFARAA